LHDMLRDDPDLRYIPVTHEGEGAAVVAGSWVGGKRAVLVMENSGLRTACEALCRFGTTHEIPVPMIMSYRGDWGEPTFWGHSHGVAMEPLLDALRIPYRIINHEDEIVPTVRRAIIHSHTSLLHTAVIFSCRVLGMGK